MQQMDRDGFAGDDIRFAPVLAVVPVTAAWAVGLDALSIGLAACWVSIGIGVHWELGIPHWCLFTFPVQLHGSALCCAPA